MQDFSLNYMGANGFAIYPALIDTQGISFRSMYTPKMWSKVRINFWAGHNPEIQLGYFRIDRISPSGNMAHGETAIARPFQGVKPVIRTFINGFDSVTPVLQLATAPTNLQGTTLTIGISVGPQSQVRTLWGSYIAFAPATASFASYGGQISKKSFSGSV